MGDTEKGYQGWTNYETWAVNLWLGNEQGSHEYWQEQARAAWGNAQDQEPMYESQRTSDRARILLAELLKYELADDPDLTRTAGLPESGMYADLLNAALSEVDWYELADALLTTAAEGDDALPYEPRE
jgi:hypothetical protein